MINKNCYYCKKPSALYLKSSESYSSDQFNFASTEIDAKDTEKKPNLFICKSCDIIFSEYCDEPFQDHYKDVLDNQYIEQIEYKKEYFNFIIKKLSDQISSNDEILEIGLTTELLVLKLFQRLKIIQALNCQDRDLILQKKF